MAAKSTFGNMVLCLTAVCLLCSALLGLVYAATGDAIEADIPVVGIPGACAAVTARQPSIVMAGVSVEYSVMPADLMVDALSMDAPPKLVRLMRSFKYSFGSIGIAKKIVFNYVPTLF